ncbi:hypothetical protein [Anaerovorax odorimutans]|uniref:hypothetical protein n=1 Tax=Anaerovorax odorimutans TaxID=109327 RepID=UPI0003F6A916|nr:hypothetical protein [Anaerovorax odorimutans]
MSKSRKLFCMVLALALVLAMNGTVFAATPEVTSTNQSNSGISVNSVGSIGSEFERESNTSAYSIISASTYTTASYIKGTVTLQEYDSGSWVTASGVSPITQTQTEYDTAGFYMVSNWNLQKGKNYRLKIVIKDKCGSVTSTITRYSSSI